MHTKSQTLAANLALLPTSSVGSALRTALLTGAIAVAALTTAQHAKASPALCAAGAECAQDRPHASADDRFFRFSTALGQTSQNEGALHRLELSDQDYSSFSGVGVIVCSVDGKSRSSTAFLVGAFDIGVTVAHTFAKDSMGAPPSDCVYNSMDALGQVRERIPVSYIKSQWEAEAAFGQPAKDLAVVRLSQPSRYAQRTMPLGRFSGAAAPVVMVGFKSDLDSDTVKRKARGTAYERGADGVAISSVAGFTHDMDSRGIAAGAPVIDERTGVIIGIHTRLAASRNTMITMNDWLEATLRVEMQAQAESRPN